MDEIVKQAAAELLSSLRRLRQDKRLMLVSGAVALLCLVMLFFIIIDVAKPVRQWDAVQQTAYQQLRQDSDYHAAAAAQRWRLLWRATPRPDDTQQAINSIDVRFSRGRYSKARDLALEQWQALVASGVADVDNVDVDDVDVDVDDIEADVVDLDQMDAEMQLSSRLSYWLSRLQLLCGQDEAALPLLLSDYERTARPEDQRLLLMCLLDSNQAALAGQWLPAAEAGLAGVWREQGQAELAAADYQSALRLFTRLVEASQATAIDYYCRGLCNYALGDFSQAAEDLRVAAVNGAESPELLFYRAMSYMQSGDEQQAMADFNAAEQAGEQSAELYFYRGILHLQLLETAAAIDDLRAAEAAGADSGDLYYMLGICYYQAAELEQAEQCLLKADPLVDYTELDYYLGLVYWQQGQTEAGAARLGQYLTRGGEEAWAALFQLGQYFQGQADYGRAADVFSLLINDAGAHAGSMSQLATSGELYRQRGLCRYQQGAYAQAAADLGAALDSGLDDAETRYLRAMSLMQAGSYQQAAAAFEQCINSSGGSRELYYLRALCFYYAADYAAAAQAFATARQNGDDSADTAYYCALSLLQAGDTAAAVEMFTQAEQAGKQDQALYLTRGVTQFELGDYAACAADMQQAANLGAHTAELYYYLGLSCYAQGDYQAAIDSFSQWLDDPAQTEAQGSELSFYRGLCRFQSDQHQLALDDFSACIEAGVQLDSSYYNRGLCRAWLGDEDGAEQDLRWVVENGVDAEIVAMAHEVLGE